MVWKNITDTVEPRLEKENEMSVTIDTHELCLLINTTSELDRKSVV